MKTILEILLKSIQHAADLPFGMLQSDGQLGEHFLPVDVCREPVLPDDILPDGRQLQVTVAGAELFRRGHRVGGQPDDVRTQRGGLHEIMF